MDLLDKITKRNQSLGREPGLFITFIGQTKLGVIINNEHTLVVCCHHAGMVDKDNKIKGLDRLLGIDAIATMWVICVLSLIFLAIDQLPL